MCVCNAYDVGGQNFSGSLSRDMVRIYARHTKALYARRWSAYIQATSRRLKRGCYKWFLAQREAVLGAIVVSQHKVTRSLWTRLLFNCSYALQQKESQWHHVAIGIGTSYLRYRYVGVATMWKWPCFQGSWYLRVAMMSNRAISCVHQWQCSGRYGQSWRRQGVQTQKALSSSPGIWWGPLGRLYWK